MELPHKGNNTEGETQKTHLEPAEKDDPRYVGPLSGVLDEGGVAFVDNSYSTDGPILAALEIFVRNLEPSDTALWNTTCGPLRPTNSVTWKPEGATSPSHIFHTFDPTTPLGLPSGPDRWNSFTLLTDGEVAKGEVNKLAQHADKTSHLPSILGICVRKAEKTCTMDNFNVSVLFAHFTAARNAILLLLVGTDFEDSDNVRVLAAKGAFTGHQELCDLPDLASSPTLGDFPVVSIASIKQCTVPVYPPRAVSRQNNVRVGDGQYWLDTSALLVNEELLLETMTTASEKELGDLARTYHARGNLGLFRARLLSSQNNVKAKIEQEAQKAKEQTDTRSIAELLNQMRCAATAEEKEQLRQELLSTAAHEAGQGNDARGTTRGGGERRIIAKINQTLEAVCGIERAGMGADALGRLSNRAARATTIDKQDIQPMEGMHLDGAPEEECMIMMDKVPVALFVRAVPPEIAEENTCDYAANFPLSMGESKRNDVWLPDYVGLPGGTADWVEGSQQSVIGREDVVVAIPVVPLTKDNIDLVLERLSLAFGGGIKMESMWLVALGSILHTLNTKQWAAVGTPVGRLLHFLGGEIMSRVELPGGHKLAPTDTVTVATAFAQSISMDIFTMHYPITGTVAAALALIRWGGPIATSLSHYTACVTTRALRAVTQEYTAWMKAQVEKDFVPIDLPTTVTLLRAIYDVRPGQSGAVVPVAGSHRCPSSWEGVLCSKTRKALDYYESSIAIAQGEQPHGGDALVTPALASIVFATLDVITKPDIAPAVAVHRVELYNETCAAAFNPNTLPSVVYNDAHCLIAQHLRWAFVPNCPLPPFATPYGPSVLYFYHCWDQDGIVTDMTNGFVWHIENESAGNRLKRLTEHIRKQRASLLCTEYGANKDGTFGREAVHTPLHRQMRDVWALNPSVDPSSPEFIQLVCQRIAAGGVYSGNIHTMDIEREVAMLAPSLIRVGIITPLGTDRVGLEKRVKLELAGRTTDNVHIADAPRPEWTIRGDYELEKTLRAVKQITELKVNATSRDAAKMDPVNAAPVAPKKKLSSSGLCRHALYLLRHAAKDRGLTILPDGFVRVADILALSAFADNTSQEIIKVADTNTNGLFETRIEEGGEVLVRATHGHSIPSVDIAALMERVTNPKELPTCIHGTYELSWLRIRHTALEPMRRNDIQMVTSADDPAGILSRSEVLIYIDVAAAMGAGIDFYRSRQSNIVCVRGPIPAKYFQRATNRAGGARLMGANYATSI